MKIEGVDKLYGAEHAIIPDRNVKPGQIGARFQRHPGNNFDLAAEVHEECAIGNLRTSMPSMASTAWTIVSSCSLETVLTVCRE